MTSEARERWLRTTTELQGEDIHAGTDWLLRELETQLNLILMAEVQVARRDPDRDRKNADLIAVARASCADLINFLRQRRRR